MRLFFKEFLMTEQDIADYLKNHPDFFTHRPELLQQLSIPHSHEAVSYTHLGVISSFSSMDLK